MRNFTSIDADKVPTALAWGDAMYFAGTRVEYASDSEGKCWRRTTVLRADDSDFGRAVYAVA